MPLLVKYQGEDILLTDLCQQLNLPFSHIYQRIRFQGWNLERALSEPVVRFERNPYRMEQKPMIWDIPLEYGGRAWYLIVLRIVTEMDEAGPWTQTPNSPLCSSFSS
jgi:hypothetical protein